MTGFSLPCNMPLHDTKTKTPPGGGVASSRQSHDQSAGVTLTRTRRRSPGS